MAELRLYVHDIQLRALKARVTLNDIEVLDEPAGKARGSQLKLNPWIVQGENRVRVSLGRTWEEETPPGGRNAPLFEIDLFRGVHGEVPEGPFASYRWSDTRNPLPPRELVPVWETAFSEPEGFGHWAWQDAPAVYPTARDQRAVRQLIVQMHAALAQRDAETVLNMLTLQLTELAQALGLRATELMVDQGNYFRALFEHERWSMQPLDPDSLDLRPQAGGRLVIIRDKEGGPPLRGSAGKDLFAYDISTSRVGGKWTIVR